MPDMGEMSAEAVKECGSRCRASAEEEVLLVTFNAPVGSRPRVVCFAPARALYAGHRFTLSDAIQRGSREASRCSVGVIRRWRLFCSAHFLLQMQQAAGRRCAWFRWVSHVLQQQSIRVQGAEWHATVMSASAERDARFKSLFCPSRRRCCAFDDVCRDILRRRHASACYHVATSLTGQPRG